MNFREKILLTIEQHSTSDLWIVEKKGSTVFVLLKFYKKNSILVCEKKLIEYIFFFLKLVIIQKVLILVSIGILRGNKLETSVKWRINEKIRNRGVIGAKLNKAFGEKIF